MITKCMDISWLRFSVTLTAFSLFVVHNSTAVYLLTATAELWLNHEFPWGGLPILTFLRWSGCTLSTLLFLHYSYLLGYLIPFSEINVRTCLQTVSELCPENISNRCGPKWQKGKASSEKLFVRMANSLDRWQTNPERLGQKWKNKKGHWKNSRTKE